MTYQIVHTIEYHFESAIELAPHQIRLHPRTDAYQTRQQFSLEIAPAPLGKTLMLDPVGNLVTRCWWKPIEISKLTVTAQSTVQTHCENPFNYLLEPWATQSPIDYPRSQFESLSPYLQPSDMSLCRSAAVADWAQAMLHQCQSNTSQFLSCLNQGIYEQFTYHIREAGAPWPPSVTLQRKTGSCRDFAVLFMAACTSVGLASRFVSGYEEGSPEHEQTLHAWVEVYLPGAGWRGYDPTLGLVVCDRHIALAAHRFPDLTAPVAGQYRGQTQVQMMATVTINPLK